MKVKDLISTLSQFDADLDVLCTTEDDSLLLKGHGVRLLEILDVKALDAEKRRGDDQVPSMKFERSELSRKYVLIDVTADF